jgi:hypothetical protein
VKHLVDGRMLRSVEDMVGVGSELDEVDVNEAAKRAEWE